MSDSPTDNLFKSEFAVMEDCKLISRAARLGWPISPEKRAELIERLFAIMVSEDARDAVSAAKAILMADTINQRREAARDARRAAKSKAPTTVVNVNTAVQVNQVAATIQEAAKDPKYLEWLELNALAEDRDPGPVCPPHLAQLEDDQPPSEDQSTTRSIV